MSIKKNNFQNASFGRIPSDWRVSKVKEEALVVTDYVANGSFASLKKNVTYKETEDYAVLIRQIDYNNNFSGPFVFIDKHAYNFLSKSQLYGGEIIISNVGNIGIVFRCPKLKYHMSLAPNVIMAKFKGDDGFYHYWFKGPLGQQSLHSIESGSAQPKFNKTSFRDLDIPVPPLPTQRKIAAVLGALDDKIENNRKICANLEAQAQALFKSWFVDFEPWGGKMPKEWKMGKLGEVAEITMGQSPDGKSLNENNEGVTFFQGRAEFGNRFPTKRLSTTEPKRMAKKGDILLSVRAPVGDLNVALEDCCIGRGLAAIRSKGGFSSFLLSLLKSKKADFDLYEGAGTIFGSINKDSLHDLQVIIPSDDTMKDYERVVSSADAVYHEKELESRALAELRDALLPKLMSGELDVDGVEV